MLISWWTAIQENIEHMALKGFEMAAKDLSCFHWTEPPHIPGPETRFVKSPMRKGFGVSSTYRPVKKILRKPSLWPSFQGAQQCQRWDLLEVPGLRSPSKVELVQTSLCHRLKA
jgi:hypothetical protein